MLTVQAFSLVAIMRNNVIWLVTEPATEIGPWADQAAELLNEIPKEYIDAFSRGSAGIAVAFGLGSMVFGRIMEERAMRAVAQMEAAGAKAADARRRQEAASSNGERPPAQTMTGTGARPTHPGPISGLQDSGSPFA